MGKRGTNPLVKGKLYIRKYGNAPKQWLVVQFLGWDKMEAEFKTIEAYETEQQAQGADNG